MINRFALLAGIGVFTLAACKSPVYVEKSDDVDLNNYHTYMWVETRKSENDESGRATAFADISMRNYVNEELRERGWKEVSESPDALITYDILVESSVEQKSDPVYTRPFTRAYYNPYTRRWNTLYFPSQFVGYDEYQVPVREGTITISIIDAKNDRRIWQGWTTEDMNNARFTNTEISRSVRNIFNKFEGSVASR